MVSVLLVLLMCNGSLMGRTQQIAANTIQKYIARVKNVHRMINTENYLKMILATHARSLLQTLETKKGMGEGNTPPPTKIIQSDPFNLRLS